MRSQQPPSSLLAKGHSTRTLRSKLPASRRSDLNEYAAERDLGRRSRQHRNAARHRARRLGRPDPVHRLDRSSTMVIAAYYTAVLRLPHRARPRIGPKGSTGCLPRKCRFNLRELLSSPGYRLLPPNNPRILSAKRSTAGSSSLTPSVASCWPIRWLTASKGFARRNCSDNSSNTDT